MINTIHDRNEIAGSRIQSTDHSPTSSWNNFIRAASIESNCIIQTR